MKIRKRRQAIDDKEGMLRKKTGEQGRKQKFGGKYVFKTNQTTARTEYYSDGNKG